MSLSLEACGSVAPAPDHTQYGVHANVNPPGFYGVQSKDKKKVYKPFDDPSMKGAQCLDAHDYAAGQSYIEYLIQQAEQRCR